MLQVLLRAVGIASYLGATGRGCTLLSASCCCVVALLLSCSDLTLLLKHLKGVDFLPIHLTHTTPLPSPPPLPLCCQYTPDPSRESIPQEAQAVAGALQPCQRHSMMPLLQQTLQQVSKQSIPALLLDNKLTILSAAWQTTDICSMHQNR